MRLFRVPDPDPTHVINAYLEIILNKLGWFLKINHKDDFKKIFFLNNLQNTQFKLNHRISLQFGCSVHSCREKVQDPTGSGFTTLVQSSRNESLHDVCPLLRAWMEGGPRDA